MPKSLRFSEPVALTERRPLVERIRSLIVEPGMQCERLREAVESQVSVDAQCLTRLASHLCPGNGLERWRLQCGYYWRGAGERAGHSGSGTPLSGDFWLAT